MENKHIVKYYADTGEIEIDGVRYVAGKGKTKKIDGVTHLDYGIFVPKTDSVNEKKQFIVNKLKDKIPPERVIEEVIKGMSVTKITKLYNILKDKNPEIKRHDGCLGININGGKRNKMYLDLFD